MSGSTEAASTTTVMGAASPCPLTNVATYQLLGAVMGALASSSIGDRASSAVAPTISAAARSAATASRRCGVFTEDGDAEHGGHDRIGQGQRGLGGEQAARLHGFLQGEEESGAEHDEHISLPAQHDPAEVVGRSLKPAPVATPR